MTADAETTYDPPKRFEIGNAQVRYYLAERWDDRGPMLGFLGMNPSDASAERTDPTWLRGRAFAKRWGFSGQMWMNPYPGRSPDPGVARDQLIEHRAGRAPDVGHWIQENLGYLKALASQPAAWVVGWGDKGKAMDDVVRLHRRTLDALEAGGAKTLLVMGLTAGWNPKHLLARGTSRIPDDARPRLWSHRTSGHRQLGPPLTDMDLERIFAGHQHPQFPAIFGHARP